MPASLAPPVWVDEPPALDRLSRSLRAHSRLAVDTEANSLHAYRETVCLIQFSTPQADYLVDPLALPSLAPLAPIFADAGIEKVFHAVEYDLIGLKRDYGFEVVNIFDTMQGARILGYPQVGLDAMLGLKFGLQVDKRYQKADWAARPLSPEMLNYARLDTHYLLELRDLLQAELVSAGRWDLAREEFSRMALLEGNGRLEVPPWQRVSGAQKFDGRRLAVLNELCLWRERTAERLTRPPFKVIDDRRLASIAQEMPGQPDELKNCISEYQFRRFGPELMQAVKRGRQAPPLQRPRPVRPRNAVINRAHALGQWRKQVGQEMGMESDLILPKAWLQSIAEKDPGTLDELAALMPGSPWRLANFGPQILNAIHPKTKES